MDSHHLSVISTSVANNFGFKARQNLVKQSIEAFTLKTDINKHMFSTNASASRTGDLVLPREQIVLDLRVACG